MTLYIQSRSDQTLICTSARKKSRKCDSSKKLASQSGKKWRFVKQGIVKMYCKMYFPNYTILLLRPKLFIINTSQFLENLINKFIESFKSKFGVFFKSSLDVLSGKGKQLCAAFLQITGKMYTSSNTVYTGTVTSLSSTRQLT